MDKQHIEEVLQIIEEAMLKIKICIGRQNGKSNLQYKINRAYLAIPELLKELIAYKDAEEQGLLLRLSCNTGDAVYLPLSSLRNPVDFTIEKIEIYKDEIIYVDDADNEWHESDFGKTIFITKEEAEAALKKMQEDNQ